MLGNLTKRFLAIVLFVPIGVASAHDHRHALPRSRGAVAAPLQRPIVDGSTIIIDSPFYPPRERRT